MRASKNPKARRIFVQSCRVEVLIEASAVCAAPDNKEWRGSLTRASTPFRAAHLRREEIKRARAAARWDERAAASR